MAKSKWRARKRRGGGDTAPAGTHSGDQHAGPPQPPARERPRPPHEPPSPFWFRPVATYILGIGYILTAFVLLIQNHLAETRIGAACEDVCGGASLAGISLEWWGGLLMAGVLGARWLARELPRPGVRQLLVLAALGHAGASFAFAASQWLGIVDVCIFCQVASAFSIGVALTCLPVIRATFEAPLLPAAQALGLGVLGVLAMWPFLEGVGPEMEPDAPAMISQPAEEGVAAERDGAPSSDWVADETTQARALAEAMDSLTIGDPEAPYEFIMITDFTCNICRSFEEQHLPAIIQEGVYSGRVRVRFLLGRSGAMSRRPFYELVAASSLAVAGMPPEAAIRLMRNSSVISSPQGIAQVADEEMREKGMEAMRRLGNEADWERVTAEHDQRILRLLQAYFPGRSGTPAFLMVRGGLDMDGLPPADSEDVLAAYGFHPADHFLEFAGLR